MPTRLEEKFNSTLTYFKIALQEVEFLKAQIQEEYKWAHSDPETREVYDEIQRLAQPLLSMLDNAGWSASTFDCEVLNG